MAKIAVVLLREGQVKCFDTSGSEQNLYLSDVESVNMQRVGFTVTYRSGRVEWYDDEGNQKQVLIY